jgi:hypothetical protein
MPADPTDLPSRDSHHERIIRHILCHHRTSRDEGVLPDHPTADDGGIGTDRSASANERLFIEMSANNLAARRRDVSKHTRGAQEDVVFDMATSVKRDVVLDFDVAAYRHIAGYMDVLPQNAPFADLDVGHYVGKVPDFRSFPYFAGHIYIRGRMDKKGPFHKHPRFLYQTGMAWRKYRDSQGLH